MIKISRIEAMINKWEDVFLERIFTSFEIEYCNSKEKFGQHFSVRFSAKEATFKMLGTGWRKMSWKDIEVRNNSQGKPELKLYGRARQLAQKKEIQRLHISLSHAQEYAIAQVIGEGGLS